MEKRSVCNKHSKDYALYCKSCKQMICLECTEEHSEQGHTFMVLSKYAAQVVLPEIGSRISALPAKEEGKVLEDDLASCLAQGKDRESKRQSVLEQAIRRLTTDRKAAPDSLIQLQSLLQSAVAGNRNVEIMTLMDEYSRLVPILYPTDAQQFQLKTLLAKYNTIMQGWAAEDVFYAELQDYLLKIHVIQETLPFIHTFNATQWDTLILFNLRTQQAVKQHLDLPAGNEHYLSSVQVQNTLYFSGGYVNRTCLATTYKVTVDSNLGIQQQKLANMIIPKSYHTLVAHDDRVLLSLGGWQDNQSLNCCECYTIAKDTWEQWKPLTYIKSGPYACSVYPQYVYCFGGYTARFETWLEKIDMQSPGNGWAVSAVGIQAPFLPDSRYGLAIQLDADSILLFGNGYGSTASCIYRMSKNACEQYQTEGIADKTFVHSYPIKYNGKVYAFGHDNQAIHEYTIATNTWKCTALPP